MPILLTLYRIAAYVTGVGLVLLVCVAMPIKYLGDNGDPVRIIGQVHGFLFAAYVVIVLLLGYSRRWTWKRVLLVLLAGVVPFVTFVAEHRVYRREAAELRAEANRSVPADATSGDGE